MAKKPSILEKFKKSITGPRTPGNPGVITGGRAGNATDSDRAANDPLYGRGESSVNQAIFGPTKAEVERFLKENPVYDRRREDYDPALADIQRLKDRKARAESGFMSFLPTNTWTYLDQQKLEELEAAYGGEEEEEKTPLEQKTDEITDLATTITTKSSGVSAGPAQDAAEEFKEKGRKSTILTSAQGITDEPVTGLLSEDEAEAEKKRKLRERRSLLAG